MAKIKLVVIFLCFFFVVGSSQRWLPPMSMARRIQPLPPYEVPIPRYMKGDYMRSMLPMSMVTESMVKPEEMSIEAIERQRMPVIADQEMSDLNAQEESVPKVIPILVRNIYYVIQVKSFRREKEDRLHPPNDSNGINTYPKPGLIPKPAVIQPEPEKNIPKPEVMIPKPYEKPVNEEKSVFKMIYPEYDDDEKIDALDNEKVDVQPNDDSDKMGSMTRARSKDMSWNMIQTRLLPPMTVEKPPVTIAPIPEMPKSGKCFLSVPKCGERTTQLVGEKTLGGRLALNAEFPWQVSVQLNQEEHIYHLCSGALILKRWVVTTASCVQHKEIRKLIAILGSNSAIDLSENATELHFDKKIIHPEYDEETFSNNIALLRLSKKPEKVYPETDLINSVCLCQPKEMPSKALSVSGWGEKPDRLHTLDVNILPENACHSYENYFKEEQMICAGDPKGRRDGSERDEGGPLVLNEDGQGFLLGIVSYNRGNEKTVYVKIPHYLTWIKRVVDKNCKSSRH